MANSTGQNPWIIDTASATAITNDWVFIKSLVWHEPTTAAHALEVTNKSAKNIWSKSALAGGAGLDYEIELNGWYKGVIVPTLGSGTLYVHLA